MSYFFSPTNYSQGHDSQGQKGLLCDVSMADVHGERDKGDTNKVCEGRVIVKRQ